MEPKVKRYELIEIVIALWAGDQSSRVRIDCGKRVSILATRLPRSVYADMFGPTTGDRVRLADTDIIVEWRRISPATVRR